MPIEIRRRLALAAAAVLVLAGTLWSAAASAAPQVVAVRVEGATQTLFEAPLLADGHRVKVASDPTWRHCDGTNGGRRQEPGATPSAATFDAMRLLGLPFDGYWHVGFDDYFVQQIGPDRENEAEYWHWGVLVNRVFASVGGCQQRVGTGDEVLWAYNAFRDRPILKLAVSGDTGSLPTATATVPLGAPLSVTVLASRGGDDAPVPAAGVPVAPVATEANGFQTVLVSDPATVRTGADGRAALTFATPGWHRVKAGDFASVRSNRLDVCVHGGPTPDCGPPPPDAQTRIPPPLPPDDSPRTGIVPSDPPVVRPGPPAPPSGPAPRLQLPAIVADGAAAGRVGVRWKLLDAGVGVRSWRIDSRLLAAVGRAGAWTPRADGTGTGAGATSARLRLPAGVTSELRITVTDALGRESSSSFGRAVVPRDDRARGLTRGGRWSRATDAGAWLRTVSRAGAGATLRVTLGAGRPTFVVRSDRRAARIAITAGRRREVFTVAGTRRPATRLVSALRRSRAGTVELAVLSGTVNVDGVALQP